MAFTSHLRLLFSLKSVYQSPWRTSFSIPIVTSTISTIHYTGHFHIHFTDTQNYVRSRYRGYALIGSLLSYLHTGNTALIVGLSNGLSVIFAICLLCGIACCVIFCLRRNMARYRVVATTPSASAPVPQLIHQHCPAEINGTPQEAPPPYPGDPPISQVQNSDCFLPITGCTPPPAGVPQAQPQSAPPPYDKIYP